jgi:hypothetical protein
VMAAGFQLGAELFDVGHDHRLTAGEDDVTNAEGRDTIDDFRNGDVFALGVPTGVGGVAPDAAQVAAAGADEDGGDAGKFAFALDREEEFGEFHGDPAASRLAG